MVSFIICIWFIINTIFVGNTHFIVSIVLLRQYFWRRFLRLFSGLHSISEERRDSLQTGGEEKRNGDNYSDKLRTLPVLQDIQVILFSISRFDFIFITFARMLSNYLFLVNPRHAEIDLTWPEVYHFLLFSHTPTVFPYLLIHIVFIFAVKQRLAFHICKEYLICYISSNIYNVSRFIFMEHLIDWKNLVKCDIGIKNTEGQYFRWEMFWTKWHSWYKSKNWSSNHQGRLQIIK